MLDPQTICQTLAFCFVISGLAAPILAPVLINLLASLGEDLSRRPLAGEGRG